MNAFNFPLSILAHSVRKWNVSSAKAVQGVSVENIYCGLCVIVVDLSAIHLMHRK